MARRTVLLVPDSVPAPSLSPSQNPVHRDRCARIVFWIVVVTAVAVVLIAGFAGRERMQGVIVRILEAIRDAGPWAYFVAMAILPSFGFPLLPFVLAAGPAFSGQLGTAPVVLCAVLAILGNVLVSYGIAISAFRPLALRVLARLGYRLPDLPPGSAWHVVGLVRIAPGLPFWAQSYLLGLMRVPVLPYAVLSTAVPACYVTATIMGWSAMMDGRTKIALLAFGGIGGVALAVRVWRLRSGAARSGR